MTNCSGYRILRGICFHLSAALKVLGVRFSYAKTLRDVWGRVRNRKVRVLFPENDLSKWKVQSVFDLMSASGKFEPVVALTLANWDHFLSSDEQEKKMATEERYFEQKGMKTVRAYDVRSRKFKRFSEFNPDIVFYNQPWGYDPTQMPDAVSQYALTCYVPYFVLNYGDPVFDVMHEFHRQVWRHFLLSESWAKAYRKYIHLWSHSGELVGLGHPQLDYYVLHEKDFNDGNTVIYAPHYSVDHPGNPNAVNYSTFLWTGRMILEYAKSHREFNWVFKPHPGLREALILSGAWTEAEVNAYWSEWEAIGAGCYTCEYPAIFVKSKALITDCGSFLPEYFATGKPLIHLISPTCKVVPAPPAKMYFDTFYQVHNVDELHQTLRRVLEAGEDYRKEERLAMLEKTGLRGNYAAEKIARYLEKELRIT